jgi:hypothetical protein
LPPLVGQGFGGCFYLCEKLPAGCFLVTTFQAA